MQFADTVPIPLPRVSPLAQRLASHLHARATAQIGSTATHLAAALGDTWNDIDHALAPLLGASGVCALYRRSVHLTARQHAWLKSADDSGFVAARVGELNGALLAVVRLQTDADAAAAAGALLQAFDELLSGMVGQRVTEQMLNFDPRSAAGSTAVSGAPSTSLSTSLPTSRTTPLSTPFSTALSTSLAPTAHPSIARDPVAIPSNAVLSMPPKDATP
jgi:hypothetical protein